MNMKRNARQTCRLQCPCIVVSRALKTLSLRHAAAWNRSPGSYYTEYTAETYARPCSMLGGTFLRHWSNLYQMPAPTCDSGNQAKVNN